MITIEDKLLLTGFATRSSLTSSLKSLNLSWNTARHQDSRKKLQNKTTTAISKLFSVICYHHHHHHLSSTVVEPKPIVHGSEALTTELQEVASVLYNIIITYSSSNIRISNPATVELERDPLDCSLCRAGVSLI